MTRAPKEVRCNWTFYHVLEFENGAYKGDLLNNVWYCDDCGGWTGDIREYRYDVCDAKDRRKGKGDRRKA